MITVFTYTLHSKAKVEQKKSCLILLLVNTVSG